MSEDCQTVSALISDWQNLILDLGVLRNAAASGGYKEA
jgi:hypothetical protein